MLVLVVEMATALDYQRAALCFEFFCGQKDSMQKDIHDEMFPIYSGKCLSCKVVHNWVKKFSQGRLKATGDAQPGAEVVERTVKRLLRCGF
jgi:hypothetical protein